ncbi:MAG: hypothetical protein JF615_03870, partial [Asticcacaulis sp.]|nr:hypothetical protein [Asticcacaulis sp.]
TIAALINGFAMPDLARQLATSGPHPEGPGLFAMGWALNQAATRLGMVLISAGIILWGHGLLHHRGVARWIGLLALVIGGVSAVWVLTKAGSIGVPALFTYMVGQVVWNLTVAFWMIGGMKRPLMPTVMKDDRLA